jgi:putative transposase
MHDTRYDSRRFRTLNVLDDGNRQALGIEVGTSIPSQRAIRVMEQLIELHGKPAALRLDNGTELTSHAFVDWAKEQEIELRYIAPGKPNQNAFIERFNRTYRTEFLKPTSSNPSIRCRRSRTSGSSNTTSSGLTTPSDECRR